jgi:L-lactate dehydrogenase complex protein LldE
MNADPHQDRRDERDHRPQIGLFVTCLVDLFRPQVGFSAVDLLEAAGCRVHVPKAQTCCGQPAYNSGDERDARAIARQVIEAFEPFDYVVAPSGSCAGMLREHYPALFADDLRWGARATALAERCHELFSFLVDVRGFEGLDAELAARFTYHDSCSGLRELGVREQPRRLLARVRNADLAEMPDSDVCCGFGGTFCVKYPEISARMADDKIASIEASGADTLLGGDLGCLMNIAGRLHRRGSRVRVFHAAEVLTGRGHQPAIGEGDEPGSGT